MIDHKVQSRHKKLLDDHCGTHVELGDASLGIPGIVGGVMRYPVGLPDR